MQFLTQSRCAAATFGKLLVIQTWKFCPQWLLSRRLLRVILTEYGSECFVEKANYANQLCSMTAHRINSKRPFFAYFPFVCHSSIIVPHCTPESQMNSQHHNNLYDICIISRSEYKNWTFWLVEKLILWGYIHPARAWLLSSPSLPSRQVNMADSCWMMFSFIRKTSLQGQDIWKDGGFLKWLLSPLDQN